AVCEPRQLLPVGGEPRRHHLTHPGDRAVVAPRHYGGPGVGGDEMAMCHLGAEPAELDADIVMRARRLDISEAPAPVSGHAAGTRAAADSRRWSAMPWDRRRPRSCRSP